MVKKVKPQAEQRWLSAGEASWYLGRSWNTVKQYIRSGDITARILKGRYFIDRESIDNFLLEDEVKIKNILKTVGLQIIITIQ